MDEKMQEMLKYYHNFLRNKGLLADLKISNDELNDSLTKCNEIIKKLVRRIYEDKICEIDKISQLIKYLFIDKIIEGKFSIEWIENCLPKEYKSKYIIKSQENSFSLKRIKTITIANSKKEVLDSGIEPIFQPEDDSINPSKIIVLPEKKNEIDEIQTYELEEALRKQQQFLNGDQIFSKESIFVIQQDKLRLVKEVIEKSNKSCYMKFDSNKVLREAWSDN